ncbi:MAG: hypothetical protein Q8O24_06165 [Gallionellaceae bacterium]|nr:hypothetical protein [Gallionellaceae bacterium]
MALNEVLGIIVMTVDGKDVEIESLDVTKKTGRKLVKTMNKSLRAKNFVKGIQEIDLKITAVIPATGDIDWGALEGVKITVKPVTAGAKTTTYQDCFTIEVGRKYTVEGEAKQDLTMGSLREVSE